MYIWQCNGNCKLWKSGLSIYLRSETVSKQITFANFIVWYYVLQLNVPLDIVMENVVNNFVDAEHTITLGATVPTGFEDVSCKEIQEKITALQTATCQGRVYFQVAPNMLQKIHQLRSVDNLFMVIKFYSSYEYNCSKEKLLEEMNDMPSKLPWKEVVKIWNKNQKYCKKKKYVKKFFASQSRGGKVQELEQSVLVSAEAAEPGNFEPKQKAAKCLQNDEDEIRFRVTANRVGKKQCITSPEAEWHFGGALQDLTQWKVDLSNYNLEVFLTLGIESVMISLSLTQGSLHHRNITHFGKTTLRSTICYNMLRLCDIQPGDIVIDPLCGTGSISIEGDAEWKEAFHIAGDIAHPAVSRCANNAKMINSKVGPSKCNIGILKWDAIDLPLRSGVADVIITDLPFGKRMGSKKDNRILYPAILKEIARVSKLRTARACLLTHDKRCIINAISQVSSLWKCQRSMFINVGGLSVGVYLLKRTLNFTEHDIVK